MAVVKHAEHRHRWAGLCLLGVCCVLASAGCSVQQMALRKTGSMLREGIVALNQEPDYELARQAMPANLKTLEVMLASDPENPDLLFLLAQGYAAYTYLVLEDELDLADAAGDMERVRALGQRASGLYTRAQGYALRLLGDEQQRRTLAAGDLDSLRAVARGFAKEDVPALFWYTFASAEQIYLDQSNPARIAELPRVEVLIGRVLELDPTYYDGLPQLTAGVVYAGRAPMFGGDLARGKELLQAGIETTKGRFLLGKFLLARFYAVQAQDRELFCSMLQEVAAAPPDLLPEQQLMNNVSRRWAMRWRERAGSLFEGGEGGCTEPTPASGANVEEDDGMLLE